MEEQGKRFNSDEIYVFEGLNFDVEGFNIDNSGKEQLKPLVQHLKEYPSLNIVIYGHTDNEGKSEYNKILSEKRGQSGRLISSK